MSFMITEGDSYLHDKDGNGITSEHLDSKQLLHVLAVQEQEQIELAREQQKTLNQIEGLLKVLISHIENITSE